MNVFGPWLQDRKLAQSVGAKHYFTGAPCSRGHVALRKAVNGECTECRREKQRVYNHSPEGRAKLAEIHQRDDVIRRKLERLKTPHYRRVNRLSKKIRKEYERFFQRLAAGEDVYGFSGSVSRLGRAFAEQKKGEAA